MYFLLDLFRWPTALFLRIDGARLFGSRSGGLFSRRPFDYFLLLMMGRIVIRITPVVIGRRAVFKVKYLGRELIEKIAVVRHRDYCARILCQRPFERFARRDIK